MITKVSIKTKFAWFPVFTREGNFRWLTYVKHVCERTEFDLIPPKEYYEDIPPRGPCDKFAAELREIRKQQGKV